MSRRDRDNKGASASELTSRHLQRIGRTVAGERGSRIANRVSEAIGCGRIDICDDPNCPNCAPVD
jgi:hypothetical protein